MMDTWKARALSLMSQRMADPRDNIVPLPLFCCRVIYLGLFEPPGHHTSSVFRQYGGGSCRQGNKTKGPVTASDWPLSPLASLSVSAGLIRHSDAVPIDHFPTLPACEKQE